MPSSLFDVPDDEALERQQRIYFRWLYVLFLLLLAVLAFSAWLLRRTVRQRRNIAQSSARLNSILNNVAEGIVTVEPSGRIESLNPTAARIFGYPPERLIGSRFVSLLEGGEAVVQALSRLVEAGRFAGSVPASQHEAQGKRGDGTVFPLELSLSAMQLGEHPLCICMVRDITERKHSEEGLRQAAAVFRSTTEGIVITDAGSVIRQVNPAFTAITGYTSAEVIGATPRILQSGRHDASFYRKMWQQIHETGRWQGEIWNRRKDGEIYPQWLNVSAVKDGADRIVNYVGVSWDISPLKESERLKDEFIATISHELRTPLTSIRGAIGLLAGGAAGELPSSAHRLMEIAHTNSERLAHLVNDILDLEKIEAGKLRFVMRALELLPLVEQALEVNRVYAAQFDIRFVLTHTVPGAMVLADYDRLLQVLTNLLSNAAKFSPRGGSVEVGLARMNNAVRVSITDHGSGIPVAFRKHVFQRFAQADGSRNRDQAGTGLGLSISRLIIERLNGTIGFHSEPNVATTFYFDLPEHHDGALHRAFAGSDEAAVSGVVEAR